MEQIVRFLESADPTWALDIAIYEYELADIVQAVEAARARGARARRLSRQSDDEQTLINEHNLQEPHLRQRSPASPRRSATTSLSC